MCVSGNVPNVTLPYAAQQTERLRGNDLLNSIETPVIPVDRTSWRVASSTGHGYYTVEKTRKGWACECPAFEERAAPCKHVWAVRIWLKPTVYASLGAARRAPEPVYTQDWPAYDSAQQDEHVLFDPLLWSLLDDVGEPVRAQGTPGRPPIPLRTQLLVSIKKVHFGESTRRARGLLSVVYGSGRGLLDRVPNYAVPSRLFNREDSGDILLELIRRSAEPLRELEDGGVVAVDSTGFCTTCMGAYCTEKHNPGRKHRWVKAHVIIGVKTHVILDVKITDESGADCPQLKGLLTGVKKSGFNSSAVVADKAYLSKDNFDTAAELGVEAFIPFKKNSTEGGGSSKIWRKMFHMFQLRREDFDRHYHARSNVEAVFSAIKRKLGESLLSKNQLARFNELLAKLLAYNIGILVHEIHEHGIDPAAVGLPPRTRAEDPRLETQVVPTCDGILPTVTESGEPN